MINRMLPHLVIAVIGLLALVAGFWHQGRLADCAFGVGMLSFYSGVAFGLWLAVWLGETKWPKEWEPAP